MRATAIRNSRRTGPPFVSRVGLGDDLSAFIAEADVVANCLPLTDDPRGLFDAELFAAMKSDVKNLASQQEIYYADHYSYTNSTTALSFTNSEGVNIAIAATLGAVAKKAVTGVGAPS
mgnify:CR=1 FL=1